MKKLSLFIVVLFFTIPLFAQLEKGYVYLKNGTVLKGDYQYDNDKLKVVSAGNIWIFERDEVDRVVNNREARKTAIENRVYDSPFYVRTEVGMLIGNSDNSQPSPFSFTGSVNYSVNANASVGAGVGLEFFKESYLPLFLNAEYKIRNSASTPYLFLMAGYQVPLESSRSVYYDVYPASSIWPGPNYYNDNLKAKGGFLINPGIGYTQMFTPAFGMSVAFGYRFHRLNYDGKKDYELDIDYNRLSFKVGIIFN